jgi:hypothetical protein
MHTIDLTPGRELIEAYRVAPSFAGSISGELHLFLVKLEEEPPKGAECHALQKRSDDWRNGRRLL